MNKRILSLSCALLCLLAGCAAPENGGMEPAAGTVSQTEAVETAAFTETAEAAEPVRLVVAVSGDWNGVLRGEIFEECSRQLEEWSGGTLTIELYDHSRLGDDMDLIQGVQLGTLNRINGVPAYQTSTVPEAALLDMPGVFSSVEQYNRMMENGGLEMFQGYYQEAGLQLLASYAVSFRQLSSSRPVDSLEDFQNLYIRTMESAVQSSYWSALGAVAMPLPFSELYFALQQGTVAAQENPLYIVISARLYEVQQYLILTNHAPMVTNYVMNREQYEALSPEHQELLLRFLQTVQEEELRRLPEEEASQLDQLARDYGMEILTPSEELQASMQAANAQALELLRQELGAETVDGFLAAAASAETD